jgi:hypothetical protein
MEASLMEIWKDIKDYEGIYEISAQGHVRRKSSGLIHKKRLNKDGYVKATLTKNGKAKDFRVHRLVAEAFIPNPEDKPTVNHKDGIKTANFIDNLEWATRSEQTQHSYDLGLKTPVYTMRKLTDEEVREIRRRYIKGSITDGSGALSREYGITDANILKIVKILSYKNVK